MKDRAVPGLAVSLWGACVLLLLGGIYFAGENAFRSSFSPYLLNMGIAVLGCSTVGAFVAARRPRNPIGWLFLCAGLLYASTALAGEYGVYARFTQPGTLPGGTFALWVGAWAWILAGLLPQFLFLIFPDGRLPSPRWRVVVPFVVLDICLSVAMYALRPGPLVGISPAVENPFGIGTPGLFDTLSNLLTPYSLAVALIPIAALISRFRRARGPEREQIKWVAYAVALFSLAILAVSAWPALEDTVAGVILFLVGFLAIPASMGIAILRHRLYDIDAVINRTLVYGLLSAVLVLVYLASVVSLQYVLRALSGGDSQLAVVASTLVIAALFNPLRRGTQRLVDRRFYRRRYDAARTLERFGARLRDETDLDALAGGLVSVARETLQPERVSLWLRGKSSAERRNFLP